MEGIIMPKAKKPTAKHALNKLFQQVKLLTNLEDLEITIKNTESAIERSREQHQMLVNFRAECIKRKSMLRKAYQ
jgi:hypothetical protein